MIDKELILRCMYENELGFFQPLFRAVGELLMCLISVMSPDTMKDLLSYQGCLIF